MRAIDELRQLLDELSVDDSTVIQANSLIDEIEHEVECLEQDLDVAITDLHDAIMKADELR